MFDENITSITETIWLLLVNTIWIWQKLKNYWEKRNKNLCVFFFSIWLHPNTYFQKRWFLLANTTWKWQKVKNYRKKNEKKGFFCIWRHPSKGVVQSSPNTYFQKGWFLLGNNMEVTKSGKLLKKKKKKNFKDFFWYDVIQERAWFRAFLTPVFNNFFRTAFKQSENQTLKTSNQFSE